MGKYLKIKNANFSNVAVETVTIISENKILIPMQAGGYWECEDTEGNKKTNCQLKTGILPYSYSSIFEVTPGDKIEIVEAGSGSGAYIISCLDNDNNFIHDKCYGQSENYVTNYIFTVPAGVSKVAVTSRNNHEEYHYGINPEMYLISYSS